MEPCSIRWRPAPAFKTKLGSLGWSRIALSVCRTLSCSLAMGVAVWAAMLIFVPVQNITLAGLLGGIAGCIAIGICTYGCVSYVLKSPELHVVLAEVRKGILRK